MIKCFSSLILVFFLLITGCAPEKELEPEILHVDVSERVLIPLTQKLTLPDTSKLGKQTFVIRENTRVYASSGNEPLAIAQRFVNQFNKASIFKIENAIITAEIGEEGVYFMIDSIPELMYKKEGYTIQSANRRLVIKAIHPSGLYRGLQTIKQLLPSQIESKESVSDSINWAVPGLTIIDYPEYEYRGAMLDVARHFFSVEDVKRYIDLIAQYKLNTLHLHLTDDQGWRIEIKSWPKLTTIGGKTAVGGGKGGFYTQEDYKEIVEYATQNYIAIIPEIDMPGHSNAALVSYAELNCNGISPVMYTGMRVGFSSFCVDKELTYKFIDDVIRELAAMTPGEYIHLGGDESQATSDADYVKFLNRVAPIVAKYNKKVMGWEDISIMDVNEETIVQHWTAANKAELGVSKGAKVVLSPAPKTYLDMKYNDTTRIGLRWAGPTAVDSAYLWNPKSILKDVPHEAILGIESPLWSETAVTIDDVEYLAFPRIIGHAEMGWSAPASLKWESYKNRLKQHQSRMDLQGINYYKSPKIFLTDSIKLKE
ncbi:beta-N-acetylhexosaminidase [Dokdonia sinensis]|uniref:beta-N-acetylhexosaminidase n=1 Tax=Dokdonia sinensis TaxID=2479847 RepID=A0A3M0GU70_9FLAO|nr:family 20 glycosylhydrolase [Dokdonia sinensis]RMB60876.1 beta-N-acetylhexosaminidase [Dokdonia sinensis]